MSYPVFLTILTAGLWGSMALWVLRHTVARNLSWWAIPYPFFIAWIIVTFSYIQFVFAWH